MANSLFPECLVTGMCKEQVIPSVYFTFCVTIFSIFFSSFQKLHWSLGILKIFKISGRTRVVLKSIFLVQHPICLLEMRNAQMQPPNWKVCTAGFSTGTPHRSPLSPGFRVMRPRDKHIISQRHSHHSQHLADQTLIPTTQLLLQLAFQPPVRIHIGGSFYLLRIKE